MTPFDSLLTAAQAGAEWAWERLYRDLAPVVRGYLRSHGAWDADDLLGEVWLQIARNIGSFEGDEAGFRSWVFTIAHHRVIDERRRRSRRPETPVGRVPDETALGREESSEKGAIDVLQAEEITHLLVDLTDDQRDVLTLRVLGGLTVDEVAEVTGRTSGAVKALQRRALQSLERNLHEPVTV